MGLVLARQGPLSVDRIDGLEATILGSRCHKFTRVRLVTSPAARVLRVEYCLNDWPRELGRLEISLVRSLLSRHASGTKETKREMSNKPKCPLTSAKLNTRNIS